MFRNYLKVAYRNLVKNKFFSIINISGLAIGMAVCFFIFQYVRFELSYDRFHKNADRIYRVPGLYTPNKSAAKASPNVTTHPAVGPAMKADFPEVVEFARLAPPHVFQKTSALSYDNGKGGVKIFNESNFYLADASFLTMFSFPFIEGQPETALSKPATIVLCETLAKKYFGDENPLGKTIRINELPLTVTGVLRDIPENSHIRFDFLLSLETMAENFGYTEWGWPTFYNYVLLAPGVDPKTIEARFPAFTQAHMGQRLRDYNFTASFYLQSIRDIHLKSYNRLELEPNSNSKTVYFLLILGTLILVIAWINYINLSTAKSMERGREVGLRKVVGASRLQLSKQFMFEALLINFMALILAGIIIIVGTPYFDQLVGKGAGNTFLSSGLWLQWQFWLALAGIFLLGVLLVGAYPSFILSAFKPILILKGKFHQSIKGIVFRKALVTFQFVLSIMLIAGTIIVYRQLSFMRGKELGYNSDQVLVVKSPSVFDSTFNNRIKYFKTAVLKNPAIKGVAPSSEIPGKGIPAKNGVRRLNQDKADFFPSLLEIDKDFLDTYQISLAAGNNLPEQDESNIFETKQARVLVNEAAVAALGFQNNESALRQTVILTSWFGDIKGEIVGVVKNYHQRSLKQGYDPIFYYYNNRSEWGYLSINMSTENVSGNLAYIEKLYNQAFPGNAFESFFLDEYFDLQYKTDQQFGNIFSLFTGLAIFIACLGLLGLSTFAIKLRTKEIGVRKILGSTTQNIVLLLSKDFIKLVCLAALIATPVIYLLAGNWLQNFAFHIELHWLIFVVSPLLLIIISLLTIGFQSVKAALANPVDSLRND